MGVRITLRAGDRRPVVGGIAFADGVGEVEELSEGRRTYFDAIGAKVEDGAPALRPVDRHTKPQLEEFAARVEVDVPENASKTELVEALKSAGHEVFVPAPETTQE